MRRLLLNSPWLAALVYLTTGANDCSGKVTGSTGVSNYGLNSFQSETAGYAHVGSNYLPDFVTFAYNDLTGERDAGYLSGTGSSTEYLPGFSLMGYAETGNDGVSYNYGKLRPPSGWAILAGDPAMAGSPANPSYVFYSNLAASMTQFNKYKKSDGKIGEANYEATLTGFCVAVSTDGAASFHWGSCVDGNISYDGGSLTVDHNGVVYDAFMVSDAPVVWKSQNNAQSWMQLPSPSTAFSFGHPIVHAGPNNELYLAFEAQINGVWALWGTYLPSGSAKWAPLVRMSGQALSNSDFASNSIFGNIRESNHFDYTVGLGEGSLGNYTVRFVYNDSSGQMRGGVCKSDMSSCQDLSGWTVVQSGYEPFQYSLTFAAEVTGGVFGVPVYELGYNQYVKSTGAVRAMRARLTVTSSGAGQITPTVSLDDTTELGCPKSGGYWGDYNQVFQAGWTVIGSEAKANFLRGFTDSRPDGPGGTGPNGCDGSGNPQHVSALGWTD